MSRERKSPQIDRDADTVRCACRFRSGTGEQVVWCGVHAMVRDELTAAKTDAEDMRKYHFEQNERMTRELNAARAALKAVCDLMFPNMSAAAASGVPMQEPWKSAAAVLCPEMVTGAAEGDK